MDAERVPLKGLIGRSPIGRRTLGIPAALLVSGVLAAQGKVWIVDQGLGPGFDTASLPTAVTNAANGDTILVRSGSYSGFALLGKGFAVIAEVGATVTVQPPVNFPSTVEEIAAGDELILRGLDLEGFSCGISPGTVWLEDCRLTSRSFGVPAFSAVLSDHVVLQRCAMLGFDGLDCAGGCLFPATEGMFIANSNVSLEGCSLRGGNGLDASSIFLPAGQAGAPGAVHIDGRLYAANCSVTGGQGGAGFDDTAGGMGCLSGGVGGNGLDLHGVDAFVKDMILQPGAGGPAALCSGSAPGAAGVALLTTDSHVNHLGGPTRGFEVGSPLREGETLVASFTGPPGEFVILGYATDPADLLQSHLGGVLYLAPNFTVQSAGVLGADGTATFSAPVSAMAPQLEFAHLWMQGATCGTEACTLAGASVVTLLDAQF